MVDDSTRQAVHGCIDPEELVELALQLGRIDSPPGNEGEVGEFLYTWLVREGFTARKVGMFPNRFNVLGTLPGEGHGYSLLFNSHMDTSPVPAFAVGPSGDLAWQQGNDLMGWGLVNDKGPMAAFMIAAKAIKNAGPRLLGDVVLTMVVGETGGEPVDEFQPPEYIGKDIGARYLVTHGGIADYAIVGEATGFNVSWVEAGKAFFKVTVRGKKGLRYTPYVEHPANPADEANAVFVAGRFIDRLHAWSRAYEQRYTLECPGGRVVPKVNVGAVRSGRPHHVTTAPAECHLYLDIRTTPGQDVLAIRQELLDLLATDGIEGEVELFLFRRGYEGQGVERLVEALGRAHQAHFGADLQVGGDAVYTSMWRDANIFNEVGIPTVMYAAAGAEGGSNLAFPKDQLVSLAQVYSNVALEMCSTRKPSGRTP